MEGGMREAAYSGLQREGRESSLAAPCCRRRGGRGTPHGVYGWLVYMRCNSCTASGNRGLAPASARRHVRM